MEIKLQNVTCGYNTTDVLSKVNLSFVTGEFYCILGANGIGKTTLFKTLLNFIEKKSGTITIDGKEMSSLSSKEISHYISYVPQAKKYSYQYTVLDTVLMGRACYIGNFDLPSENDYAIAKRMLHLLGISHLQECMYSELSGGEQQIVLIARALAQEAKFIIMDEPASNLDFENQKKVLDVLKLLATMDTGIIMSSHSPNHAFYCGTQVVLINKDKTIFSGDTEILLTPENLKRVYNVDVCILEGNDKQKIKSCCLL